MNQPPFTSDSNSQQIALLSQRVEILISTVEQEFRGFREDSNRIMNRQEATDRKAIMEESRLSTGLKRLDDLYASYGLDRKQQSEDVTELKRDLMAMQMDVKQLSNNVSLLIKVISIIGTGIGAWILNNLLGLIK